MNCCKRVIVAVFATLSLSDVIPVIAQEATRDREVQALREELQRSEAAMQKLFRRLELLEREELNSSSDSIEPQQRFAVDHPEGAIERTGFAEGLFDDAPSVEKRLLAIEKAWSKQEDTNKKLSDADKKFPIVATSGATWKLGGRIHSDYWAFPEADAGAAAFEGENPEDRFVFRRARLEFEGDVLDNMLYRFQIELSDANSPQYRDMYIGFKELPWFGTILVGNQKRPYGLDHLNSSNSNVFMERPFIVEAFNQDARRLGIASYGLSDDEAWNWRFGVWNLENTQNDDGYQGDHYQLEVAGRLANTWWYDETSDGRGYGHWAVSGSYARPDGSLPGSVPVGGTPPVNEARFRTRPESRTNNRWLDTGAIAGAQDYQLLGLESVFNVGELQVCGEVENVWMQRTTGNDLHYWGGYVYVSYFLTGEHMPWERKSGTLGRPKPFENFFLVNRCCGDTGSGWGAWQVALRYSYADLSDGGTATQGGVGESLTLGLQWLWNANCRMQFNYTPYGRIRDHKPVPAAPPGGATAADYQIVGTRFIVFF